MIMQQKMDGFYSDGRVDIPTIIDVCYTSDNKGKYLSFGLPNSMRFSVPLGKVKEFIEGTDD